jgi:integrase/recombinase XerD
VLRGPRLVKDEIRTVINKSAAKREDIMKTAITLATRNPAGLLAPSLTPLVPWGEVWEAFSNAELDSPHTRRAYQRAIAACLTALGHETLSEVSGAELAAYRAALLSDGRGAATHSVTLAAIRSFLKWSQRFGACLLTGDVISGALKSPKNHVEKPYSVLTDPELGAVLTVSKTARDRALVGVMAGAGLRVSEAVGLAVEDVHENSRGGVLRVRHGKGGKERLVPASDSVLALIKTYLEETGRTIGSNGPLFRAHDRGASKRDRKPLTSSAASVVVHQAVKAAGVRGKTISPHSLRHTYAIRFLRNGGNIVALATILGHANVTNTQRYLKHLELDELRASVPPLPM